MRRGDHGLAWRVAAQARAGRDPATRDDPRLPYHLRWVWDGTDPARRHVLVRCYHGLGDTLQFARFIPELARRAASVTVEAPPALVGLLAALPCAVFPFDQSRPAKPSEVDIEIMELSEALQLEPDAAEPRWLEPNGFTLPPGTIGLCCRAGDWDAERSVPEALLAPLAAAHPCLSLDIGRSALPVLNPGGCPQDMAATAALLAGCAVVVTVDTMIAHLAGALGKPVLLLLRDAPDWRWVHESGRSPWYPWFSLFPQPSPGAWEPVIAAVLQELQR